MVDYLQEHIKQLLCSLQNEGLDVVEDLLAKTAREREE